MTSETKATASAPQPDDALAHPRASGLFDPRREYDACGVGFIADLKGNNRTNLSKTHSPFWRTWSTAAP